MPRIGPRRIQKLLGRFFAGLEGVSETAARDLARFFRQNGVELTQTGLRPNYLAGLGFSPASIIDIGVYRGTPFLYNAFKGARFLLVDPLPETEISAAQWLEKLDAELMICALGEEAGSATLSIPKFGEKGVKPARASLSELAVNPGVTSVREMKVEVRRLDDVAAHLPGPLGIKIDAEGHELAILKGGAETLRRTEFVIVEAATKRRFQSGYKLSELIAEFARNGFELFEALTPIDKEGASADLLFVQSDSQLLTAQEPVG